MKNYLLIALSLALFSLLAMQPGAAWANHEPEEKEAEEVSDIDRQAMIISHEFMGMINAHRLSLKLNPLQHSDTIAITALNHSRRMARKAIPFGHMGSKLRCRSVLGALGLEKGTLCGENVAVGQENPREAFESWMNSPSHREAIEDPRYTHTGLGVYEDFRGKIYWTQIFIKAE